MPIRPNGVATTAMPMTSAHHGAVGSASKPVVRFSTGLPAVST